MSANFLWEREENDSPTNSPQQEISSVWRYQDRYL